MIIVYCYDELKNDVLVYNVSSSFYETKNQTTLIFEIFIH